ncbi:DUF1077-domain-containing protein [Hesseltinella vesiculosa]|uniref:ER membrane protein complex subunit 4 n=1 Tax=Hesseltinella vesiculosa TaxID=101127 RepID=A0A1X2GRB2_9FUNG|nr:DUF1077-domain-containing protein [Hesseltinella vesiculosa]
MSTWSIDYSSIDTGKKIAIPTGFDATALQQRHNSKSTSSPAQDRKDTEMKIKRAWDVAMGPAKSIPMNAFMIYMSGSSLQIFSVMITAMLFINPVKAMMTTQQTFERFETKGSNNGELLRAKLAFIGLHIVTIGLGIYKVNTMGLLPTTTSDWLAFLPPKHVLEYADV